MEGARVRLVAWMCACVRQLGKTGAYKHTGMHTRAHSQDGRLWTQTCIKCPHENAGMHT